MSDENLAENWYMVICWIKYNEAGSYYPTNFLVSFEDDFMPGQFIESIIQEFEAVTVSIVSWQYMTNSQRNDFIRACERQNLEKMLEDYKHKKNKGPQLHVVKGTKDET